MRLKSAEHDIDRAERCLTHRFSSHHSQIATLLWMQTRPHEFRRFLDRLRETTPLQYLLYALIVTGSALRIFNVIEHNPLDHLWSDPLRHWDHARDPATPSPMALFDPFVYQTFLSVIQRLTMGVKGLVSFYVSILALLGPWCWYRFLRESLASRTVAIAGWAALSLLPTWIGIYSYFMTETLLIPMIGLSLWTTQRARRKLTFASFLVMVVVWLLTGLTRGVAIPLAAVACGMVWLRHPEKVRTAVFSAAILAVTLLPLAIRNYSFIYLWAPHGNGWLTKIYAESGRREILLHFERNGATWNYGFTSPMMDEKPFAPLSDWKSSRTGTVNVNVDFTHGTKDWEACLKQTAVTGAARWRLHLENLVYLFQGNSWPDNDSTAFICQAANLSRWLWIPLFLGVVAACIFWWKLTLEEPLLPLLIAVWFFFQAWLLISVNEGRYRKPVEGLLVAQVCVLADACCRNKKKDHIQTADSP